MIDGLGRHPPQGGWRPRWAFALGAGVKKIDISVHIGDSDIALIHQLTNEMGFTRHERKLDAGIAGEIELRNPTTGEVANRLILVQSKASDPEA